MNTWKKTLYVENAIKASRFPQHLLTTIIPLILLLLLFANINKVRAVPGLDVRIIAAPNLIVDSNVLSPSTYQPIVATVIGEFCNNSGADIDNLMGYIGDGVTPGTYPIVTDPSHGSTFITNYRGDYSFTHLGGAADAARSIGTLPNGECRYQYWSFTYPKLAINDADGSTIPAWGTSVKDEDDLQLSFHIWADNGSGSPSSQQHTMTMRNEISAMANKIKPNGNPGGYWFNTATSTVLPGDTITTNGILYRLGNINQGFDNDGNGSPDYNAWVQPFGDPSYDPSCFRLISTSGVLTVTRSAGNPDMIINFEDQLYFTDIPADNTNVSGEVFYEFLAIRGACTIPITPYQEVASGFDNEKFNGDYGTGIPPVASYEPEVTLSKTAPDSAAAGTTITYAMDFANTSATTEAGLTFSSGGSVDAGLMISDTIPAGLVYVAGSAADVVPASTNSIPTGNSVTIRYYDTSTSNWTTNEPPAANVGAIQWWLDEPLAVSGSGNNAGTVRFQAAIPGGYSGDPFIENCAKSSFGDSSPFAKSCDVTRLEGTNSIGDYVWADVDTDGVQDGSETGIDAITVWLYWDENGNGDLDDGEMLVATTETLTIVSAGYYEFTSLPDGDYIVKVDGDDVDLPTGYNYTTPKEIAVTGLSGGVGGTLTVDTADFGFGPILDLTKSLINGEVDGVDNDNHYEGQLANYVINVINTRPGGTGPGNACQYFSWAGVSESTGPLNSLWSYPSRGTSIADGSYAIATVGNNPQSMDMNQFDNLADQGTLNNVKLVVHAQDVSDILTAEYLDITVNSGGQNDTFRYTGADFTGGAGTTYELEITTWTNIVWTWFSFDPTNPNPPTINLVVNKTSGNSSGQIGVDAASFVATTNETCGDAADTLNPVPVIDTYNSNELEFVSANPPISSQSTVGAGSTLTWNNVGTLAAGEVEQIEVVFKVLATGGVVNNQADTSNAKYQDGRNANDATDNVNADILDAYTIGDYVWFDSANLTVQDANEPGLAGVVVELYFRGGVGNTVFYNGTLYNDGDLIATVTTDANGAYLFEGVPGGGTEHDYEVIVNTGSSPILTGLSLTTANQPYAIANLSADDLTTDFGYNGNSIVYGSVWHDANANAAIDSENHISGVTVYLDDGVCTPGTNCPSTTTDENGRYQFTNVVDGNYTITVVPPGAQVSEPTGEDAMQVCGTCNNTYDITVDFATDPINGGYNFGYTGADIGDTLYVDWNGNGAQDTGEEGIPNVDVNLYHDVNGDGIVDPEDTRLETIATDSSGNYLFTNYPAGNYLVIVDTGDPQFPGSYVQTADPDATLDSKHAFTTDGVTDKLDVDFGYQPQGSSSIGDFVWQDDNGDGVQDTGETGIADITVVLYEDQDGNGSYDPAVDAVISTTVTATDGSYLFPNLPAEDYLVDVDTTDPQLPTDDNSNAYVLSTNNDPHAVTLTAGTDYTDADFGFTAPGAIGDFIWQDNNGNGEYDTGEPGINGVVVNLYIDSNNNGILDGGDAFYDSETTANDSQGNPGYYRFSPLSADNYIVEVDSSNFNVGQALEDYTLTADPDSYNTTTPTDLSCLSAGAQACDGIKAFDNQPGSSSSDVNPGLALGQIDLTADFGYQPAGIIGDYVWGDFNADGVQDPGEPGFEGVDVFLCTTSDPCTAASGDLVATATTNADGYYYFTDVTPGTYIVSVDTGDLPANWTTNTYDRDGSNNSSVPGIVVDANGDVTSVNSVACTDCHLEMDFGYRSPSELSGFVFFDTDNDGGQYNNEGGGGTDTPYPNIYVYLYDSNDDFVGYTTTDSDGKYVFDVPDGDYTVRYGTSAPALQGLTSTAQTSGGNDVTIDGAIEVTLSGTSEHNDFGFFASMDCGDLPEGNFHTTLSREGACHVIGDHYLGAAQPDAENDGQADALAGGYASTGGDDNNGSDDEDGVNRVMSEHWLPNTTVHLNVDVVGADAYLVGWLDWDNSGAFDSGEMIEFGSAAEGSTQSLAVAIPSSYVTGTDFMARFRLYDGQPATLSQSGQVTNGEVEDYYWEFGSPTAVSLQNIQVGNTAIPTAIIALAGLALITMTVIILRRRSDT